MNKRKRSDNTSGFKGVSWHASSKRWRASMANRYIGLFSSKEDAAEAYAKAATEQFGEFARPA